MQMHLLLASPSVDNEQEVISPTVRVKPGESHHVRHPLQKAFYHVAPLVARWGFHPLTCWYLLH